MWNRSGDHHLKENLQKNSESVSINRMREIQIDHGGLVILLEEYLRRYGCLLACLPTHHKQVPFTPPRNLPKMVAKFQPLNQHVKQQTRFKTRAKGKIINRSPVELVDPRCHRSGIRQGCGGRIAGSGLAAALLLWPVTVSGTPAGIIIYGCGQVNLAGCLATSCYVRLDSI